MSPCIAFRCRSLETGMNWDARKPLHTPWQMLHFALTFWSPVDFIGIIMIYHTLQVSCRLKTLRPLAFAFVKICTYVCWYVWRMAAFHKHQAVWSTESPGRQQDLQECERSRATRVIIIFSILKPGLRGVQAPLSLFFFLYSVICIQLSMHKMCWGILPRL